MEFQPTFEAVRDKLSQVQLSAALESFQKARKSLHAINHLEFLQGFVLLLRFGQVVATGIIALIYFYFVYQHQTHECRYWPDLYVCRDGRQRPDQVPISYVFILTAVSFEIRRTFFFATFLPTSEKRKKINCFCSTIFRVLTQTLGRSLISPAFSHYAHQTSDPYFLPAINLNATKYSDQKLFWDRRSSSLAFRYPGCCRLCHCLHLPLRLCCSIRDPSGRSRRHTLL